MGKVDVPQPVGLVLGAIVSVVLGLLSVPLAVADAVLALVPRKRLNPGARAVVITGCDTGFGRLTAERLDRMGFSVFAACLKRESADQLQASATQRLKAFVCDVTKDEDVAQLVQQVDSATNGAGVWAVINNAGVLDFGPFEWLPMSAYYRDMEVNYFGTVRVAKAFLPLLKKKQGRIINIASIAGLVSVAGMAPYAASKYAVEAFSDALRRDVAVWKVGVAIVEPAIMRTPILAGYAPYERLWEALSEETRAEYGEAYKIKATELGSQSAETVSHDPSLVVDTLVECLTTTRLSPRYRVGWDGKTVMGLFSVLPAYVQDLLLPLLHKQARPAKAKL